MNPTYAFAPIDPAVERARLQRIEATFDATTHQWLQQANLTPGQTVLEVGPGAGSIAQWLSQQVGDRGRVVAIDHDPTHWQTITTPNLEKVICDLHQWDYPPKTFDLIHARYVLIHVPQAQTILQRLYQTLKPGGVMVLEEPDFSLSRLIQGSPTIQTAYAQVNAAIAAMFRHKNLDPAWGLQLPTQLMTAGFELTTQAVATHLAAGGSAIAQLMAQSAQVLVAQYVATGEVTPEQLQVYCESAQDAAVWAIYFTTVRAIARRPF
ncbi:MAG: methyltransferase domain-containing protein [Cyanobacteria bacterium P01_G01_bin.54]